MKHFQNITTIEELKTAYRVLAIQNHPDKGGNTETMQSINNEYETRYKELFSGLNSEEQQKREYKGDLNFTSIIQELIKIDKLDIEICGNWVWIDNPKNRTEETINRLKELNCFYSGSKKRWYWNGDTKKKFRKARLSMNKIRGKYGSITFQGRGEEEQRKQYTAIQG